MIAKEVDEMLRNSSSDKELICEKVDKMRQCFLKKFEEILVEVTFQYLLSLVKILQYLF